MPNLENANITEAKTVKPKGEIWRSYDVTDGLPAGAVCLYQDATGYLWIGTNGGGVSVFDGHQFTTYTTADGLAHNMVVSICRDGGGRLWFGTGGWFNIPGGGVSVFDGHQFTTYTTADGLAHNTVTAICNDRGGKLWFGTWGGVSVFDGHQFTTYTTADGLAHNTVRAICNDRGGKLWFGTVGGVSMYDGHQFTTYTTDDGLAHNAVIAICNDAQGRLWFGTWGGGVSMYDGHQFTTYTTDDGLAHNVVNAICRDGGGRLWFGTESGGVSMYDGHQFVAYTTDDGLLDNRITGLLEDKEGRLWFAQLLIGVSCLDNSTFQPPNQILPPLMTQTPVAGRLIQDGKGRFWFGDANHLCCLFGGQQHQKSFNGRILPLLVDSDGALWVGTDGDGLYRYDSSQAVWDSTPQRFTLSGSAIWALLQGRDGTIWVGTSHTSQPGGLFRLDGERFQPISIPQPAVLGLYEDSRGRIWFGGFFGGGLSCYDGEHLITYTMADGLADDSVMSIVEDNAGNLWIGTLAGLCRFDGKQFITYATAEGLSSLQHRCSAKDINGHLWFGTLGGGLYRYNGKHFQQLTTKDGLLNNGVMGLVPQPDGSMIIGTNRGIVHYRPTETVPPGIEIRGVTADSVYPNPTALQLNTTDAGLLTISYHGVSLATQKMRYSYILEGYDDDWRDTWENSVSYDNLPVGEYTFLVIAINRDLVESEAPATMKLTIVPDPRDQQIEILQTELNVTRRLIEQQFNPYIVGRVVGREMYFGRDELIDEIQRTVANNCFLVHGERRIGKTSLQHQLIERLQSQEDETIRFIPAYIDLQGVAEADFFATIATSVAEASHPYLTKDLALRIDEEHENYTYRHLNRDMRTLLNHLMENETRTVKLVLLMDEIDTLNQYQLRTNLNLRGLFMGSLKENLSLVMTGWYLKTNWSNEGGGSPPFNFLSREIELQPLDHQTARQLITAPVEGVYTYDGEAVEKIIASSENRPFTIQAFCMRAINRILANGRTMVTGDDIEAIKDSVLAEVASIRGERAGTALPASFNEALTRLSEESSRVAALEAENEALRQQISVRPPED